MILMIPYTYKIKFIHIKKSVKIHKEKWEPLLIHFSSSLNTTVTESLFAFCKKNFLHFFSELFLGDFRVETLYWLIYE